MHHNMNDWISFCFVIVAFLSITSLSFNLEERLPLIKHGKNGSLFGLSVAEHHILANASTLNDAVLLIGAPTADADTYHSKDSYKPGALYKCGISSDPYDCQSVVIDTSVNTLEVNNSNQWLGVTVKEEKPGGRVVVCAHRYTIRGGGGRRGIIWEAEFGRCYVFKNDLTPVDQLHVWTPCIGKTDPGGSYSQAFYGYCQAGTSVAFANNKEEDLIFGMPGALHWTGALKSYEFADDKFFPAILWSNSEESETTIHQNSYLGMVLTTRVPEDPFSDLDKAWISNDYRDFLSANSYLGFSLTTGFLVSGSNINFIAGAPRSNDTGEVVIFEKVRIGSLTVMRQKEILRGQILASSFGYTVGVFDLNGDGREDLIVGAPQYYDREKKIGGAVYIYINKGTENMGPDPTKILYGDMESAFGSSITNLGDLNMDGTNDIAIGAPGTDSGVGAVFIYHGNDDPNEGVYDEPTQVLYGKDLKETAAGILQHEMKGFGYSLSGGLDMDFNGYPDLLIGSLSDTAVLYRTRPIVNVEAAITSSVNKINVNLEKSKHTTLITLDSGTKYKRVTFNVTVCMSYTSTPATFNEYVNIKYTIKLDPKRLDQHLLPRASLDPYEAVVSSSATMSLYPQSLSKPRCKEKPVYVKKEVQDKLSPIEVSLEYEIVQYDITPEILKEGLHSTNDYPILNKDINNLLFTQVNISKNCGSDEICESNLRMTAEYVIFPKNSKNWEPLSTGSDGKPLLLVGNEKEIGIRVIVTNPFPGEDGHQAVLHVILPDFMHYVGTAEIKANTATASCNSIPGNSSVILCNLGNPFRANSSISAIIKLENNPKLYEVEQIETNFLLETSSVQKPVSFSYSASIRVQYYLEVDGYTNADQLPFSGEVVGESAVRTAEDAGLIVEHVYELENAGNDNVNEVYVNISWPQQTNNGKWLFYLLDSKVSGSKTNTSCNIPENLLNPLKLKFNSLSENLMEQKRRRRRRDTAAVSDPADIKVVSVNSSPNKVLTCSNFAKCLNFTCFVGKIDSEKKIFISVKGVIWNSTFLEEYYGVPEVRVYSNAKVWINRANIFHDVNSVLETSVSTSILAEKVVLPETKVSMWLVIVAIVSGVILLVVIVLILWRCGFFKRRRDFGDYHKARRHKQASKVLADNADDKVLLN